jgi:putative endonuclease
MEHYAVYILATARNGTLYVGVTNDLTRRVAEHRSGLIPGFTQRYTVNRLVHVEFFASIDEARTREARLKRWRREWKLQLIEAGNPEWDDLVERLLE